MENKKISAAVILSLKEALSVIYWYKGDLRKFLTVTIGDSPILGLLNWDDLKRNIAWELVDRLCKNEAANQAVLLHLIYQVSQITNFSHLERLENGEAKARAGKNAVQALRSQIGLLESFYKDSSLIGEQRARYAEEQRRKSAINHSLEELRADFSNLVCMSDRKARGYEFERFLCSLFEVFDLDPRASFRCNGEQIDGAFTFENTDYLVEAKWQKEPVSIGDLYKLQGAVLSKLENTLGVFISINGFSNDAVEGFCGARPNIFLMDGADLMTVLENRIGLSELLRLKRREASQTGNIYLRAQDRSI